MWLTVLVVLLAAARPGRAATFETALASGELAITSLWETGFCGAIM